MIKWYSKCKVIYWKLTLHCRPILMYTVYVWMKCDLCSTGEVTPGLSQTEYELRRYRLASLIEAQADRLGPTASSGTHVVIVLSHPTRYMTNDIPYPFHQNQVSSVILFLHNQMLWYCLECCWRLTYRQMFWRISSTSVASLSPTVPWSFMGKDVQTRPSCLSLGETRGGSSGTDPAQGRMEQLRWPG